MKVNDSLYNFCCWNDISQVNHLLKVCDSLDILYKNGELLNVAIQNDNVTMLQSLLNYYYDQHKLKDQSIENYTLEQSTAKHRLYEILRDTYVPEGMVEFLKEYSINLNDDGSSVGDFEEKFEDNMIFDKEYNSGSTQHHTPEKDKINLLQNTNDIVDISGEISGVNIMFEE